MRNCRSAGPSGCPRHFCSSPKTCSPNTLLEQSNDVFSVSTASWQPALKKYAIQAATNNISYTPVEALGFCFSKSPLGGRLFEGGVLFEGGFYFSNHLWVGVYLMGGFYLWGGFYFFRAPLGGHQFEGGF